MNRWVLIDYDFRDKLPKEDCEIWITRVCFTDVSLLTIVTEEEYLIETEEE